MRFFIQRTAKTFSVTGWVRNRFDGSVEALLQGEERVLDTMITVLRSSAPGTITELEERIEETQTVYGRFQIRLI
jgi:acylphosphatase